MGKYLNVGNAGFEAVRKSHYVDKTEMISFINSTLGTKDKLSCDSRELFAGLKISNAPYFE